MLDLAFKHEEEIKKKMFDTWYVDKYKYYHCDTYYDVYSLKDTNSDWDTRQFVSLDSNGSVLGFIKYCIDRTSDFAYGFGAINFSDNKITFGLDLAQVIDDIFCKFNIRKLEFMVLVGNPIEKSYDKMIQKYGGRIVGTYKERCKLIDGKYYDQKMYEIFREDYIKHKLSSKRGRYGE